MRPARVAGALGRVIGSTGSPAVRSTTPRVLRSARLRGGARATVFNGYASRAYAHTGPGLTTARPGPDQAAARITTGFRFGAWRAAIAAATTLVQAVTSRPAGRIGAHGEREVRAAEAGSLAGLGAPTGATRVGGSLAVIAGLAAARRARTGRATLVTRGEGRGVIAAKVAAVSTPLAHLKGLGLSLGGAPMPPFRGETGVAKERPQEGIYCGNETEAAEKKRGRTATARPPALADRGVESGGAKQSIPKQNNSWPAGPRKRRHRDYAVDAPAKWKPQHVPKHKEGGERLPDPAAPALQCVFSGQEMLAAALYRLYREPRPVLCIAEVPKRPVPVRERARVLE